MAQAFSVPSAPYSCSQCPINYISNLHKEDHMVPVLTLARAASSRIGASRVSIGSHLRRSELPTRQRRLNAVDTHIVENAPTRTTVEIPVTCYQVAFHNLSLSTVILRICVCERVRALQLFGKMPKLIFTGSVFSNYLVPFVLLNFFYLLIFYFIF